VAQSATLRGLLINKIPVFTWRGEAAPGENWDFTGILFYGKPLTRQSFSTRQSSSGELLEAAVLVAQQLLYSGLLKIFPCNAAKRPLQGRFAAYLFLEPIFLKTLSARAF
jgi:hypothetical protein